MNTEYDWAKIYNDALLETDWPRIEERIQEADNKIRARLHEFSLNHGGTAKEKQAIEDALNALNVLRKEVATWQRSRRTG